MQIEIWSDIVCPWCWLGKRRFERALASLPEEKRATVNVVWRSFQLDPRTPKNFAGTIDEWLEKKGMPRARIADGHKRLTQWGADIGLTYNFAETKVSNSFDAHRVLHYAATQGKAHAAQDRVMQAHHAEGARVGDHETLVALATEVGLDANAVRAVLASDQFAREVNADIAKAHALGIDGVPCFVADEQYAVSGAQDERVFADFLSELTAR
jgi:predicted DsbA family dithiol-disulfide isomerase